MCKDQYKQALIDAAYRFGEIAKDVAGLGDKHVSVYTANAIAHKADLEMHLILKALGRENEDSHETRRAAILNEKDALG